MTVEIKKFDGDGYKPLVDYGEWRVAFLNPSPVTNYKEVSYFERHNETDEVFVLLQGTAYLVHAGAKKTLQNPAVIKLEKNTIYNVKKAVWHLTIMNKGSKILIVENKNTTKQNTEYFNFPKEEKPFKMK